MTKAKKVKFDALTAHLFNAITEDELLIQDPTTAKFIVAGQILPDELVRTEIKEAATAIIQMRLWKWMMKDLQHDANYKLYFKSNSAEDMYFPKACLYVVDLLQKKMEKLARMK